MWEMTYRQNVRRTPGLWPEQDIETPDPHLKGSMMKTLNWLAGLSLALVMAAGCADPPASVEEAASNAEAAAEEMGEAVEEAAETVAEEAGSVAKEAGSVAESVLGAPE